MPGVYIRQEIVVEILGAVKPSNRLDSGVTHLVVCVDTQTGCSDLVRRQLAVIKSRGRCRDAEAVPASASTLDHLGEELGAEYQFALTGLRINFLRILTNSVT
ncbi:unannotated protein [freshwater metagenome]|uniref:Unannotated protein n=1 Tax=freshwater metagenome TaxID=449393 RepID=A0A6J6MZJ3_9ZZZZ